MLKNPDTGRRISRPNPRAEWQSADAQHLRIVDEETFARAQQVKAGKAYLKSHHKRRPRHILSGLIKCGSCGSGMSAYGRADTGRRRIRCSAMYESGTCRNKRSVYLDTVESLVFDGMREQFVDPRLIEVYVRAYNAERKKAALASASSKGKAQSQLASLAAERERMVGLIVRGVIEEEDGRVRLAAMKAERLRLEIELAALGEAPPTITLHPATIERYLATVERLAVNFAARAAEAGSGKFVEDVRALIHSVTVHAPLEGGMEVEVKGHLAALIGGKAFPEGGNVGRRVVAEAGLEPATYGL